MSDHPGYRIAKPGEVTCAECRCSWQTIKGGKRRLRCAATGIGHAVNYMVGAKYTCYSATKNVSGVFMTEPP